MELARIENDAFIMDEERVLGRLSVRQHSSVWLLGAFTSSQVTMSCKSCLLEDSLIIRSGRPPIAKAAADCAAVADSSAALHSLPNNILPVTLKR